MKTVRLTAASFAFGVLLLGCRHKAPPPPPPPALQNLVVLLPNEDGTSTGSLVMRNAGGTQHLTQSYSGLKVEGADVAPSAPFPIAENEVKRLFQDALSGIPPAESRFNLYFLTGGTALTPESEEQLPAVLQAYRDRQATDVTIIGHSDTVGDRQANHDLALKRAESIRERLQSLGVAPNHIFTASHGEGDLLVPTTDEVSEPRNRRVEIIVR